MPLVWVVTPEVVWQSMQGYADVPMALMLVLGAVVLWKGRQIHELTWSPACSWPAPR